MSQYSNGWRMTDEEISWKGKSWKTVQGLSRDRVRWWNFTEELQDSGRAQ
jgi:hypothetical protein